MSFVRQGGGGPRLRLGGGVDPIIFVEFLFIPIRRNIGDILISIKRNNSSRYNFEIRLIESKKNNDTGRESTEKYRSSA